LSAAALAWLTPAGAFSGTFFSGTGFSTFSGSGLSAGSGLSPGTGFSGFFFVSGGGLGDLGPALVAAAAAARSWFLFSRDCFASLRSFSCRSS